MRRFGNVKVNIWPFGGLGESVYITARPLRHAEGMCSYNPAVQNTTGRSWNKFTYRLNGAAFHGASIAENILIKF